MLILFVLFSPCLLFVPIYVINIPTYLPTYYGTSSTRGEVRESMMPSLLWRLNHLQDLAYLQITTHDLLEDHIAHIKMVADSLVVYGGENAMILRDVVQPVREVSQTLSADLTVKTILLLKQRIEYAQKAVRDMLG